MSSPDTVPVDPPVICGIQLGSAGAVVTATLNGVISGVKTNDKLLLLKNGWAGDDHYVFGSAKSVTTGKDPRGNSYTQIALAALTSANAFSGLSSATDYRLMKSAQSSQFFQYEPPSSWQNPQSGNLINLAGEKSNSWRASRSAARHPRRSVRAQTSLTCNPSSGKSSRATRFCLTTRAQIFRNWSASSKSGN